MNNPDAKPKFEFSPAALLLISVSSLGAGILIGGGKLPWPASWMSSEPQALAESQDGTKTAVRLIAVSDDGAFLDVVHRDAECLRRDALTGRNLHRTDLPRGKLPWLVFSGAGQTWAGFNRKNEVEIFRDGVRLWQGRLPGQQPGEAFRLCRLCEPRGLAAVISNLGSFWLLDCAGERVEVRRPEVENSPLSDVSFAPIGDQMVLITHRREFLLWDAAEQRVIRRLEAIDPAARFASWSGDGRRLITFGGSRELHVWDVAAANVLNHLTVDTTMVVTAELSFDGHMAAAGDGNEIRLWNLDTGEELPSLAGHQGMISSLQFADESRTLFSGDTQGRVCRWSLTDYREIWAVP